MNSKKSANSLNGSYQLDSVAVSADKEISRLKYQTDLFWDEEIIQYRRASMKDSMTILELGSGPGFVTEKLVQEFPNSSIVCVERDTKLIEFARQHCRKHKQVKYQNIPVEEVRTIDKPFDVVVARLVVEHLTNPLEMFHLFNKLLRKNGILIVTDNDFGIHTITHPESPSLRDFFSAYCKAREDEGGSPKIGRTLPLLFKKSKFNNINMTTLTAHNQLQGDAVFLQSEGIGIPLQLVKKGYLSSKKLSLIAKEWKNVLTSKEHCIMRQVLLVSGRKM